MTLAHIGACLFVFLVGRIEFSREQPFLDGVGTKFTPWLALSSAERSSPRSGLRQTERAGLVEEDTGFSLFGNSSKGPGVPKEPNPLPVFFHLLQEQPSPLSMFSAFLLAAIVPCYALESDEG